MKESESIIKFYLYTNKLKEKIRQGWIEVGIKKERLESVAEHIYGCLMLAIAIDSEYHLELDMYKVLKMISLHELEEILMPDFTVRSNITKEEKDKMGIENVKKVVSNLMDSDEIVKIINEFNKGTTKEAKFSYHIDKIECDMQAKIYDLMGVFDYELAKEDLNYYGKRKDEIAKASNCASDLWIEYDRPKYNDDEIFSNLLDAIKNLKKI